MSGILTRMKALSGALILLALAACSGGDDKPSDTDIKNAIAFTLPAGIEVSDVDILVSENAGTKVEPLIRDRSKVTLKFTSDFVTIQRRYGDKYIFKKTFSEGQDISGTVISSSRLKGETWSVHVDRMDMPTINGKALSQYAEGSYAFDGTPEADAIKTAYEEKLAAEQKAREEAQAKAAADRAAAIAQAAKDKADRIAAFRATLAGTWVAKTPMMHNGNIWIASKSRETGGIEVTFPEGTDASGIAKVTLYVMDDPLDQLTVNAGFTVAADGKSAKIAPRSNTLKTLDFYFGGGAWTFDGDGKMEANSYNNRWTVQLEKDGPALAQKRQLEAALKKKKAATEALAVKYKAGMAPWDFSDIGINRNVYTFLFVTAQSGGDRKVYGDGTYGNDSSIALAAVHAGLLKPGEGGVVKVTHRKFNEYTKVAGTLRNGIQSAPFGAYDFYTIELVEKLKVD